MKTIKTLIKNALVLAFLALGTLQMTACDMSELAGNGAKTLVADGTSLSAQVDGKSWSSDLGAYYIPWKKGVSVTGTSGMTQLLTVSIDALAVGEFRSTENPPLRSRCRMGMTCIWRAMGPSISPIRARTTSKVNSKAAWSRMAWEA